MPEPIVRFCVRLLRDSSPWEMMYIDNVVPAQIPVVQRYYSNLLGRFYSPDPGGLAAANLAAPSSWNMYQSA